MNFLANRGLPLLCRPDADVALELSGGRRYRVGEVLALANAISNSIKRVWPEVGRGEEKACILLSSEDPYVFLGGLLGGYLAGACVVSWSPNSMSISDLSNLVLADGVILPFSPSQSSGDKTSSFRIEKLKSNVEAIPRPGNVIIPTSGSTGVAKGVALTLEAIIINASLAGHALGLQDCEAWAIDLDFGLMSAIGHFFMAWQARLPLVHLGGMDAASVDEIFFRRKTGFGGAPLQLKRHVEERERSAPICMVSSGDFLTDSIVQQVRERFPACALHSFYGLTEVSGRFCFAHDNEIRALGQAPAGRPLPGFGVRIVDEYGHCVPLPIACGNNGSDIDDEHWIEGEIQLRTPLLFHGYYKEQSFFSVNSEEWFSTGDLARINASGTIFLVGRSDDVFKVGGIKVNRTTIEKALSSLLEGHIYCVLPVSHPIAGKVPALFIEHKPDRPLPAWKEIISHLRSKLPSRFLPVYCYKLEHLPRLPNGKIDRQRLVNSHEEFDRLS